MAFKQHFSDYRTQLWTQKSCRRNTSGFLFQIYNLCNVLNSSQKQRRPSYFVFTQNPTWRILTFYTAVLGARHFFSSRHRGVFSAKLAPPRHIWVKKLPNWAVFFKIFHGLNCFTTVVYMYLYLVWPQSPSFFSNLGIFNLQRSRFLGKIWLENVAEMAPFIFAPLPPRHYFLL